MAGGYSGFAAIERGEVGGTCVNTGCVPSKALLAAAAARHIAPSQAFPGIATRAGPVDMAALIRGKDDVVAGMRAEKYVDMAASTAGRSSPGPPASGRSRTIRALR